MYSYGSPHMAAQKQDDQLERTFSSYVRIQDVVLKTYLGRWTIGRSGERGSGISVLPARYDDDDDDDIYIYDASFLFVMIILIYLFFMEWNEFYILSETSVCLHSFFLIYIYIYIYMRLCVWVCVCVFVSLCVRVWRTTIIRQKGIFILYY